MSSNIHTGNSTRLFHKLSNQLSLGRFQMENYAKEHKHKPDLKTYYLLRNGNIVTYREWHQLDRPTYLLSGSKQGCQSYKTHRFK